MCFQDEGEFVVLTKLFVKNIQKKPRKEIKLAERFKKEYLSEKLGGK